MLYDGKVAEWEWLSYINKCNEQRASVKQQLVIFAASRNTVGFRGGPAAVTGD